MTIDALTQHYAAAYRLEREQHDKAIVVLRSVRELLAVIQAGEVVRGEHFCSLPADSIARLMWRVEAVLATVIEEDNENHNPH